MRLGWFSRSDTTEDDHDKGAVVGECDAYDVNDNIPQHPHSRHGQLSACILMAMAMAYKVNFPGHHLF